MSLIEKIAEHAHLTWQRWMGHMLSHLDEAHLARWKRQANTRYEDLPEHEKESDRAIAREYLALIRSEGYVKLAEDQSVPENPYRGTEWVGTYSRAQRDMQQAGFRKVEKEDNEKTMVQS